MTPTGIKSMAFGFYRSASTNCTTMHLSVLYIPHENYVRIIQRKIRERRYFLRTVGWGV
jgi:hypothetical protein